MPPRRQQTTSNTNKNTEEDDNDAASRTENLTCRTQDGTTGMCYSINECMKLDGRSVGPCDDDGGDEGPVCCVGE